MLKGVKFSFHTSDRGHEYENEDLEVSDLKNAQMTVICCKDQSIPGTTGTGIVGQYELRSAAWQTLKGFAVLCLF